MLLTFQRQSILPGNSLAEKRTERVLSSQALPNLGVLFGNLLLKLCAEKFPSQRQFCHAVVLKSICF